VGRRTNYWIVYTVDEDAKTVNVLRFWNASKEPASFEI
jgi:mRNA-degrading endonuclease RelE of RelBE toxin-antitoxin system